MIEIYTDGACIGNPGPGGWAAIVVENGSQRAHHGSHKQTTNNRMEMVAVIEGLKTVPEAVGVTVFSDSQYVVNTMARNWKRKANRDLWARMDAETAKRDVDWKWVRGHDGNPLNEAADELAHSEARGRMPTTEDALSHLDDLGMPRMVDVGSKSCSKRIAVARCAVRMHSRTLKFVREGVVEKGDVLGVARLAGIMGAKNTSLLIPLCHTLPIDHVGVEFRFDDRENFVEIEATASATAKTGVEMEALTAVTVAALTIYDMCKSIDREIRIENVRLVKKSGGESGDFVLEPE